MSTYDAISFKQKHRSDLMSCSSHCHYRRRHLVKKWDENSSRKSNSLTMKEKMLGTKISLSMFRDDSNHPFCVELNYALLYRTEDFSGVIGLNLALGLITSFLMKRPYVGLGPWAFWTPQTSLKWDLGLKKKVFRASQLVENWAQLLGTKLQL